MEPNSNYQVFNEDIEIRMKELGQLLGGSLPEGWGFTLLLFDFNTTEGSLFYTSNAAREDVITMMKKFIAMNEKESHEKTV